MEERNLVEVEVAGKRCNIWQHGSGGPVILWGMYPHEGNELAHMQECLEEMSSDQNFLLAAFQAEDWNRGGHFADSCRRLAKGVKWLL